MATRKNRKTSRKDRKTRKQEGGKRRMSSWNKLVKRTFEEMRRKDRKASFGDALKEAARRKSRGEM
jgi:hypothetical protein